MKKITPSPSSCDLNSLENTWKTLGEEDPLWAVASHPDKRGGKWEENEFFLTGKKDVSTYVDLFVECGGKVSQLQKVLDFGCGVGRLTRAWSDYAEKVIGVDISSSMIRKAEDLNVSYENVEFYVNSTSDLSQFHSDSFDIVASHICLQHMPYSLAELYIAEFARICAPKGFVMFQLPARAGKVPLLPRLKRFIVDHLPFGLSGAYRRWRNHSSVLFDMYFTSSSQVEASASNAGLVLRARNRDTSSGEHNEGYLYCFQKNGN